MSFSFTIFHRSSKSKARVGRIHTAHGVIDTPNFVAVGTNGTLKAVDHPMVESIGLQLMFCNTYHMMLQPGADVVQKAGGLHSFTGRTKPIITDSGGFQVFSLAYGSVANELKGKGIKKTEKLVLKIHEDGVVFRSYRDGAKMTLTPETSVQAQKKLGADIIIPFDELPPYHITPKKLEKSLERTHLWEKRSLLEHKKNPLHQAMYAVVHGGVDYVLRKKSCAFLTQLGFDGFAIGGSMGKTKQEMFPMLDYTMQHLPEEYPVHLLGIGDLDSISACIPMGMDTFDSSYPTRAARHGMLLTRMGSLKIAKTEYREKFAPIEEDCPCFTCQKSTMAYLHHLYKAKEMTFTQLATIHNLSFMVRYMEQMRKEILQDQL